MEQIIILKDSNTDEVDYILKADDRVIEKAIEYKNDIRENGEADNESDIELIEQYLDIVGANYEISKFQDYKIMYY